MKKVTIKIPAPVTLTFNNSAVLGSDEQPVVISFKDFVNNTLLIDPKFGKSMADILSAVEIKNKLSQVTTEELELDHDDWDRLNKVAAEPTNGYNPVVVVQIVDFLTAIRDAK